MSQVDYDELWRTPHMEKPMGKFFGLSKTIWANIAVTAVSLLTAFNNLEWVQDNPQMVAFVGAAIGVANVLLRLVTNQPVTIKP